MENAYSLKRVALTADEGDLSEVAARIAEELELSPEMLELLLPAPVRARGLTPWKRRP